MSLYHSDMKWFDDADRDPRMDLRDRMDLLVRRIELLEGSQRALMEMHWVRGASLREIAQIAGVAPSTIGRRIQRISRRLADNDYYTCVKHRRRFTAEEMDIARDLYLHGYAIDRTAQRNRTTIYRVRQTAARIQALCKAAENEEGNSKS